MYVEMDITSLLKTDMNPCSGRIFNMIKSCDCQWFDMCRGKPRIILCGDPVNVSTSKVFFLHYYFNVHMVHAEILRNRRQDPRT